MNANSNAVVHPSVHSINQRIRAMLHSLLPKSSADLQDGDLLTAHGMDSLIATQLSCLLAESFDLHLSPTIAFDFPTLDALEARISELTRARHVA